MPSIASHFSVAKQVGTILNICDHDFMLGNILPDIIDLNNSHFKIRGSYYLIPDIEAFLNNQDYNQHLLIGCLTHLLLDKYFLEEYVPNNILEYQTIDLFSEDKIYEDYTSINYTLIKEFELDVSYINNLILSSNFKLSDKKVKKNIDSINSTIERVPVYINLDTYKEFLINISKRIAEDITNILNSINNPKERIKKDNKMI